MVAAARLDVALAQSLAVDRDEAVRLLDGLARQADQPLDEGPARVAGGLGRRLRRVEDDDLAPAGAAEVVDEAVREYAVGEAGLASLARPGAVQGRLHRGRWDAVRVDDPFLDREHDQD